jgi:LysM repeat protein
VYTNVVVRRQFFTWTELESEDYATFITNLRSINCPEKTIRDIIIADVDALFARRRSTEVLPTRQQWWQSEPDSALRETATRQLRALEQQRNRLLTELLGPDWNAPTAATPTVAIKVPLDGPLLGSLSPETQQAIQTVSGRTQQRFEALWEKQGGYPDAAALAGLERSLRQELAPLLTPAQWHDFLFRYSFTAQQLRAELQSIPLLNPTASELQTVFRNLQEIDLQLMSLEGDDPAVQRQREALLRSRTIAFQNGLGPARYREYERLQDPAYAGAVATARAAGVTNAAALFYAIDRLGAQQQALIRADTNLTPLQQELALRRLELEQLQAAAALLGQPESPPAPPLPPTPPQTYSFQKGDTIAEVSRRTGVPVALLLRANPNLQAENIPPGTPIIIPNRPAPLE